MMNMGEMAMMSGMTAVFVALPGLALPFLYIYLVQDFSGRRDGTRDPLLGTKALLTFLMTLGAQLALLGVAMIAAAVVGEGSGESAMKTGAGLVLGGALTGAFPALVYRARVGSEGAARIGHQALGLNAVLTGLVFAVSATITSVSLFHDEKLAEPAAVALVYLAATAAATMRLLRSPLPPAYSPPRP